MKKNTFSFLKNYDENEEEKNNILSYNDNEEGTIQQLEITNYIPKNKSPEEQFKEYPNYHFFRLFGILFCKIGNTLTCNFDKKNNNAPKICIGPNWYLALVANMLITFLVLSMYYFLIESKSYVLEKILYIVFSFMVYFFFNRCVLINPGIIQNKKKDNENIGYCCICQVYYNPSHYVEHCSMCDICVEKMDHHCIWVGKCVGKKNCFSFYAMLVSIGIVYCYIMIIAFLQYYFKLDKKQLNKNVFSILQVLYKK